MNHLSDIGFDIKTSAELAELFADPSNQHQVENFREYSRYCITDLSGSRLFWITKGKEFICFLPAFKGISMQTVKDVKVLRDPRCFMETSLNLWVYGKENEEYPLIVETPNYFELLSKSIESINKLQITLFANSFEYYENEEVFNAAKVGKELKLGSNMFVPTGTFSPDENKNFIPHAECWCYGTVLKSEVFFNKLGKQNFHHYLIKTYAATYDVVVEAKDAGQLKKEGSIIGGTFWPCALLV